MFDKSLLARLGKFKLDDADSTIAGLFPLFVALQRLVSRLASLDISSLVDEDRVALGKSAKAVQALASELEAVSGSAELDFSTVQHVVAWLDTALSQLSPALAAVAGDAVAQLAPLRQALTLTSGKAMEPIWRSSLPFKPSNAALADAYERLLERGRHSAGEVWEYAVSSLFLEISVVLGVPQTAKQARYEGQVIDVVEQLLKRIPAAPVGRDEDERDPVLALTDASNAAALVVAELAAVSSVLQGAPSVRPVPVLLLKVARVDADLPRRARRLSHRQRSSRSSSRAARRHSRTSSQSTSSHSGRRATTTVRAGLSPLSDARAS